MDMIRGGFDGDSDRIATPDGNPKWVTLAISGGMKSSLQPEDPPVVNRQKLPEIFPIETIFPENSATRSSGLKDKTIMGEKTLPATGAERGPVRMRNSY